jgi:hypothetical protein
MFVVTEADATAIHAVFRESGELSAAIELRRLFPGVTDNALARECARTIAGWKPLRRMERLPKVPRFIRPSAAPTALAFFPVYQLGHSLSAATSAHCAS